MTQKKSEFFTEEICQHDKNFFQLFKDQVNRKANDIAIVSDKIQLTYREIDDQSNILAQYLRICGIKKGDFVGLSVGNNAVLIIGILGILKAGGVYLPLDPNYPQDRLQFMLEDAKPSVVLTQSDYRHLFVAYDGKMINLDEGYQENITPQSHLEFSVDSEDLAYVIYTSGSTGKPKGIMVVHRSLHNIALAHKNFYPTNLKALLSGGVCFDVSILIIFYVLIDGGTLYLSNCEPPSENILRLIEFIKQHDINFMICVPSLYTQLLENSNKLSSLQSVSLTGENVPASLCKLHAKKAPNAFLYNEYGPTEYAIGTTIAKVYDPAEKVVHKITIGKPLPNTQVFILDHSLQVLPIGGKGEICIGGVGLAKGYLNNDALTAEKFVWVTLPNQQPMRLYKTGDYGRLLPNGEMEFLGRMDHQAQIQGHQIPLGEIEHAICQCVEIKEAVVFVQEDCFGQNRLVVNYTTAYQTSTGQILQSYLMKVLPEHMVPSAYVQMESFPLSPNGKIDRDLLNEWRI